MSQLLEELVTKFVYDVDQTGLRKYDTAQKKIKKNTKDMIKLNSTLTKGLLKVAGAFGLGFGLTSMFKTYEQLDLTRRSIEGLTKSTEDWAYVQNEAFRTATDIEVVAKGYRNFFAAANMAGFDKNGIQEMYSGILVSARAIGATSQQTEGALLALEQMISKGVVSMEELRRQLGNALPGAFEIGAKAMNMTTQEFNKLVKTGKLASKEFVPKFVKTYLDEFGGGFGEAMKSANAAIIRLRISWKQLIMTIGDTGAGAEIAKGLNYLAELLRSPEIVTIAKGLGLALQGVAKALGFVVKHFRMILFIFGVNALKKIPMMLNGINMKILDIATSTGKLRFGLNGVVEALSNMIFYGGGLKPLLKAIGMSVGLLMKNLLPIIAIGAVITTIALALEDIFMYLRDPNALTLTRELAQKSPEFAATMERVKKALEDFDRIFKESVAPSLLYIMESFNKWVAGAHPKLGALFEFILIQLGKILDAIADIIRGWEKLTGKTPEEQEEIKSAKKRTSKRMWDSLITAGTFIANPGAGISRMAKSGLLPNPDFANSYNLQKSETYAPNVTINNKIIGGANTSAQDIANAVNKQLSGIVDRANMSTMKDRPKYMSTMADKPR